MARNMLQSLQDARAPDEELAWLESLLPAVGADAQSPSGQTRLAPGDEARFQRDMRTGQDYREWFDQFTRKYGGEPSLDDPEYDYRAAWRAGIRPAPYEHDGGAYHWASALPGGAMLKGENHPTAWMEHFMRATGRDPNDVGVKSPQEAEAFLAQQNRMGRNPWMER